MCLHLFTLLSSALRCSRAVFGSGDVLHTSFVFLALNPCFCWEWQLSRVHMSEPVTWSQRLWIVLLLTDIIKHYMTPSKIQPLFEVTAVERAVFAHRVMTGLIFWSYSQRWDVIFFSTHCFHKAARDSVEAASCFPHSSGLMFSASLVSSSVTLKGFFLVLLHKWCLSQPDSLPDPGESGPVTTFRAIKEWVFHLQRGGKSGCGRRVLCLNVKQENETTDGSFVSLLAALQMEKLVSRSVQHFDPDWNISAPTGPETWSRYQFFLWVFLQQADVLVFHPDTWRINGCFATNFQSASAVFSVSY